MECILKYFPGINEKQKEQFAALKDLYTDWNAKINVISRKDIDNLYLHHVLHSLSIAKFTTFNDGTKILDAGTGGGFPGIPLAIMFPASSFHLVDSIGKKIKVAADIAANIGLDNVSCSNSRIENENGKFDFVVSRSVMNLDELVKITKKNISAKCHNAMPNGVISLKGGDVTQETKHFKNICEVENISIHFKEEYFQTKKIIYIPLL